VTLPEIVILALTGHRRSLLTWLYIKKKKKKNCFTGTRVCGRKDACRDIGASELVAAVTCNRKPS
jgi:hypothetical protein